MDQSNKGCVWASSRKWLRLAGMLFCDRVVFLIFFEKEPSDLYFLFLFSNIDTFPESGNLFLYPLKHLYYIFFHVM